LIFRAEQRNWVLGYCNSSYAGGSAAAVVAGESLTYVEFDTSGAPQVVYHDVALLMNNSAEFRCSEEGCISQSAAIPTIPNPQDYEERIR
jgi:hypothetical protein